MEIAGLAIGVASTVGVLGQIFSGCIKAYSIFTDASNLGRDSDRLVCKIRIEEMRLKVWGREWGVIEGKLEEHLLLGSGAQHEGLKTLAEMILTQLYQTIMDLNKLQDKYGLREASPGSVDKEAYKKSADPRTFGVKLRAKWVISDKDKFGLFLHELQYFNDRLEGLFPPACIATLQRTWRNELLQIAQRDLGELDLLESASSGLYPGLNAFAHLKQLRINLDAKEPSKKILSSSELKLPRWRLVTSEDDKDDAIRCTGVYQSPTNTLRGTSVSEDVDVFVEWTRFDLDISLEARLHLYQRIDNLTRMLHSSSNRHPDLHTLDCLGYVEDTPRNCYGMIYLTPPTAAIPPLYDTQTLTYPIAKSRKPSDIQTLAHLIAKSPTPDLNVRFKLAHTLAIALWSCHSLDWLHKSLCPQNILFFADSAVATTATTLPALLGPPHLAGFDSSRPDHLDEMTVASRNEIGQDLYRHPQSLGVWRETYRKSFDIYSLGLVLLEIGLWKGLEVFGRGKHGKYTPTALRDKIVQVVVPGLGPKTGAGYRRVVERCLGYEEVVVEGAEATTPHQVMEWVVLTLEGLKV